jgi:hypothetical protein
MRFDADPAAASRAVSVFPSILPVPAGSPPGAGDGPRIDVPLDLVSFRAARGTDDLRRIAHLREEIALSAHVRENPDFARLEKKETTWGWSARSSAWEP